MRSSTQAHSIAPQQVSKSFHFGSGAVYSLYQRPMVPRWGIGILCRVVAKVGENRDLATEVWCR